MHFKKGILISVGELFLKSKQVRSLFQRRLLNNIKFFLKKEKIDFSLFSFRERIFIETEKTKRAKRVLKKVFGIAWLSESFFLPKAGLEDISSFAAHNYKSWIKREESFAIFLKKGGEIKEKREAIIRKIAKKIERKVDLKKPKKKIFVEARKNGWFLYFRKEKGAGGLPLGAGGRALVLISGGIDSPVAGFLVAKRGVENIWLHFHSFPLVSQKSIEKTRELAGKFLKFQPKLKVYFFPFSQIQMEIKTKVLEKYRILLYRRAMLKIAREIAKKENCQALVTGESLGQVSSQTLPNLAILQKKISFPVLRPLIGMDKEEIIALAKKINTYQISIKSHEDCCSLFAPKKATAKGSLEMVKRLEKELNIDKVIKESKKKIKVEFY